ncbi:MAG TPA: hypothetical protein VG963_30095 [Polyangiaceae bacterium]|nr:hypothetical protein [Polyangiaceae bacterium]
MTGGRKIRKRTFGRAFQNCKSVARGSLLAIALASGAGCTIIYGSEFNKKQCKSQTDCDSAALALGQPLVCLQETCQTPACTQSSECPANSSCNGTVCVAGSADAGSADAATNGVACTEDGDCGSAEQRCGYDGYCYAKWGCLSEEAKWPPTPFNVTYTTTLRSAEDPGNPAAVHDERVELCIVTDPNCANAVVKSEQVTIGADATVTVPLVNGSSSNYFVGFARFTSPPPADGGSAVQELPAYRLFTADTPLAANIIDPITINLVAAQTLALQSAVTGIAVDTTQAILEFFVADCGGRPAPGMSVSANNVPNTVFLPLTNSGPVLGSNQTTTDGTATLLGVPGDKLQTFTIRDEGLQRVISSTLTFSTHSGANDYFVYYPRNSALQKWLAEAKRLGMGTQ